MQHNGLDRRTFLKGAGTSRLSAPPQWALTGCGNGTVPAGEEPVNASAGQVPGTPSWLGQAPEVAERDITETIDTEVLVVGCRTAGLPAVISAAEDGAKVLGIDRTPTVLAPREDIGVIDSKLQLASFDEYPQFKIDKMEAMEDIVRYANGFINYDLVKVWANQLRRPDRLAHRDRRARRSPGHAVRRLRRHGGPGCARQGVGDRPEPEQDRQGQGGQELQLRRIAQGVCRGEGCGVPLVHRAHQAGARTRTAA